MGKVKRRLLLTEVNQNNLNGIEIEKNMPIFQSILDEDSFSEVGFVVDFSYFAFENNQRKVLLLIQCQMNKLRTQNLQSELNIQNSNGPKLTLLDLPYAVDGTPQEK